MKTRDEQFLLQIPAEDLQPQVEDEKVSALLIAVPSSPGRSRARYRRKRRSFSALHVRGCVSISEAHRRRRIRFARNQERQAILSGADVRRFRRLLPALSR